MAFDRPPTTTEARIDTTGDNSRSLAALSICLAAALLWLPLPFGSVTPVGSTAAWVFGLVSAMLASLALRRSHDLHAAIAPGAALVVLACSGILRFFAWPIGLVRAIAPRLVEISAVSAAAGAPPSGGRLSIAPAAAVGAALAWVALAGFFGAAVVAGRQRRWRRWLGGALLLAALFQVFFGAQQWLTGAREIWGRTVAGDASRLRGTFINSDHLALYLEIALAVAFALGWWAWRRGRHEPLEARLLWVGPPVLLWLTLFVGLAFTGSRAGLLAGVVGTAAQGIVVALVSRRRRRALIGGAAVGAGLLAVGWIGFAQGFGRILGTSAYDIPLDARTQVYRAAMELWWQFPIFGTGLGSFGVAFPLVQPAGVGGYWRHLHNDWLELLVTTGIVGLAIVLVALAFLVARLRRVALLGRRGEDRAAAIAACGALFAVGTHSLFDFGLTLPANSATLVVVLGAAAGARTLGRRGRSDEEEEKGEEARGRGSEGARGRGGEEARERGSEGARNARERGREEPAKVPEDPET